MTFNNVLFVVIHNFGLFALLAIAYGYVLPHLKSARQSSLVIGLLFGFGVVVSMTQTTEIIPGVRIDPRNVLLTLIAPIGGPIAAIIAAAISVSYRAYLGGAGMLGGVASIMLGTLVGMIFARDIHSENGVYSFGQLLVLGLVSCVTGLFILTADGVSWETFWSAFLPLSIAKVVGIVCLGMFMMGERRRHNKFVAHAESANRDPLTGLLNRRGFELVRETIWRKAAKHNMPVGVVVIDIDHFKMINDRWGHDIGDVILRRVASKILENCRPVDAAVRYGGEEIIVLMPGLESRRLYQAAERLRCIIDQEVFHSDRTTGNVTASLGVSSGSASRDSFEALFKQADAALYRAKKAGRNRVEIAGFSSARDAMVKADLQLAS